MEHNDLAPAVSFSLGAGRAQTALHPHRRAWRTAVALGVIGGLMALWGTVPSQSTAVRDELAPSAPLSQAQALASACEGGVAIACNDLGVTSLHASPSGPALAARAFERACENGSPDGCSNLGALYEHGRGVGRNLAEAASLYERACVGGVALGCSNLGALYARGRGVARDGDEAQRLFQLACDGGSAAGCNNLMQVGR